MVLLYKPQLELQDIVSSITLVHYQLDKTQPSPTNPLPPQPEHCLIFYPYDKIIRQDATTQSIEELPRSIIVGPKIHRVDLTMGYNSLAVIVSFKPGGLHRLLRIPMNEILNQSLDSSLVFGKEIDDIIDQVNLCTDTSSIIQTIEQFLWRKSKNIKESLPVDQVLTKMLQCRKSVHIDQLAKETCISIRQLERQFKERTGLPPKVFVRLVRFSKAWVMRENNPGLTWLQIAHACEYADQMHMIRDFKDFTGVTPGVLQTDLEKSPLRLQESFL